MTSQVEKQDITHAYSHMPSAPAVVCGLAFGAARIACSSPLVFGGGSALGALAILIRNIAVPMFEEWAFRSDIHPDSSILKVLRNSIVFGLIHGLFPGDSFETRVAKAFSAMIGGLFYCGAKMVSDDLWSPAIAHILYNSRWTFQFIKSAI